MARDFDGVDDTLRVAVPAVTATPLTISGWFNPDVTAEQGICVMADEATDEHMFQLQLTAGGFIAASARDGPGVTNPALTTTSYSLNIWQHACGVFTSATLRAAFLNGGGKGTNTVSTIPAGLDNTTIGFRDRLTNGTFMNGRIAEVAIWDVALSDDEVLMLANGLHPFALRPGNIVGYWPCWGTVSPEPDWSGKNNHMVVTGAIRGDHPTKISAYWLSPQLKRALVGPTPFSAYEAYFQFDATQYAGAAVVRFEVIIRSAGGVEVEARLFNITDNIVVAGSSITTTSTTATRLRSGIITLTGVKEYRAEIRLTPGETTVVRAARLIVQQ